MTTIFILLGLGFLGGGIAAIVDGLPYMVLERGFTQVIIGTVVAVAGVVMLALSWVLVELRRIRTTLSNAATAMSVASMVNTVAPDSAFPLPPAPPMPTEPGDNAAAQRPGLAVAGAGALAGAGVVLAATHLAAASPSEKPEDKAAEPDPFGARLAEIVRSEPGLERDTLDEPHPADVDALPAFDPFRPVDPQGEPESEPDAAAPAEPAPEAALLSVVVAEPATELKGEPVTDASEEQEAEPAPAPADEPPEALVAPPGPSDIEDPLTPAATPVASREADEFGMLRESLAGLGLGLGAEPVGARIEPSFSGAYHPPERTDEQEGSAADDLAAAASWMEPALQRRAPWFENPAPLAMEPVVPPSPVEPAILPEMSWPRLDIAERAAPEPDAADRDAPAPDVPAVDLPPWPPHARDPVPFEPEETSLHEKVWEDAGGEQEAPEAEPASASDAEPAASEVAATNEGDAAPAASEEGVVGAYQVGEAHFTIFADGSIQARTPDGDYSFASMDELKVYLASEKSRLGV